MTTAHEQLRAVLRPGNEQEEWAVAQLRQLDDAALRLLQGIFERGPQPIIFVRSDDDEAGGYKEGGDWPDD